jgi:hypothetical protein
MAALSFNLFLLSCFTTFALLCFTTTALTTTPTITKPRQYVTKLIHPGSVHSSFYNPTATVSDRARRVIDSSSARLAYLQAKFQEISLATGTGTDDVRAGVIVETDAEGFVANISIGEPPSPQLLVIDTGSSLSWTQCQPCSSCFQQAVLFLILPSLPHTKGYLIVSLLLATQLLVKGVMHQVIAPSTKHTVMEAL